MTTLIRIKYSDNFVQTDVTGNTSRAASDGPTIDKELLVNINCNTGLIEDYIRESACLESTGEFDLWEESTSQLKNISSREPHVSGLKVFQPNQTYLLIIIERDPNGQIVNYVPMINGKIPRALTEVIAKMRRLSKKHPVVPLTALKLIDQGGRKKSTRGKSK